MAKQVVQIFVAVAFYWCVSISMVFINKALLSGPTTKLDAPMFITWYQCIVTVILCYILGETGIGNVPRFEVKWRILKQMLSLSAVFTAMIVFNNLCLKWVEISFYHVARSLTIVFNVIFGFLILGTRTSLPAMGCCGIVILGYLVGNKHELRWTMIGVVYGVAASFFVALNSIMVKKKYPLVDNDAWKITLYNNLNASFLFLPVILFSGEVDTILTSENARTIRFWGLLTISGALGILMSFAYATQVKHTSPLTHNVSATAKSGAQSLIAWLVYQNPINQMGALGIGVVFIGSTCYGLVRLNEMNAPKEPPVVARPEAEEVGLAKVKVSNASKG